MTNTTRTISYPDGFPIYTQIDNKYFTAGGNFHGIPVKSEESRALRLALQADTKRRIMLNRKLRATAAANVGKKGAERQLVFFANGSSSLGNQHAFTCC